LAVPLQALRYGTPTGKKLSDAVLTQAAMSIAIFGQAALKRVSAFVLCGWSIGIAKLFGGDRLVRSPG